MTLTLKDILYIRPENTPADAVITVPCIDDLLVVVDVPESQKHIPAIRINCWKENLISVSGDKPTVYFRGTLSWEEWRAIGFDERAT